MAGEVEVVALANVLNDTEFIPVQKREMLGYDIAYELNVFFDVRLCLLLPPTDYVPRVIPADARRRMTTVLTAPPVRPPLQ